MHVLCLGIQFYGHMLIRQERPSPSALCTLLIIRGRLLLLQVQHQDRELDGRTDAAEREILADMQPLWDTGNREREGCHWTGMHACCKLVKTVYITHLEPVTLQEPLFSATLPVFQYSSHVSLHSPNGHMWYAKNACDKGTLTLTVIIRTGAPLEWTDQTIPPLRSKCRHFVWRATTAEVSDHTTQQTPPIFIVSNCFVQSCLSSNCIRTYMKLTFGTHTSCGVYMV